MVAMSAAQDGLSAERCSCSARKSGPNSSGCAPRSRCCAPGRRTPPTGVTGALAGGTGPAGAARSPPCCIVLGCILAPVSVLAVWTANQVSDTNRYVENVAPLIHEPAVQSALTDKITNEINARIHVQALTNQAAATLKSKGLTRVGTLLQTFSGSLAGAVSGFIHTQVAKIVASPQVANLWVQVNRTAHAQLVKALSGQGNGSITISNGQVVLNLGPVHRHRQEGSGRAGVHAGQQHPGGQPHVRPVLRQGTGQGAERLPGPQRPEDRPAHPDPAAARAPGSTSRAVTGGR